MLLFYYIGILIASNVGVLCFTAMIWANYKINFIILFLFIPNEIEEVCKRKTISNK